MLNSELNLTRRIGCEFEMAVPLVGTGNGQDVQQSLARVLTANGLRAVARGYCRRPLPQGVQLAVEYDASIRGESQYRGVVWHSIEVKTRILNGIEDWETVVPKALAICRYMGARVNRSTGHHLNLDFPEVRQDPRVIRSLYNLVHRFEPVVYGLVGPVKTNRLIRSPHA